MLNYDALNMNIETIIPEIIVLVVSLVVIFYDLFARGRENKSQILAGISIVGYVAALLWDLPSEVALRATPRSVELALRVSW